MSRRRIPNILVTGTPGVGKSSLCQELAERTGMEWINIGDFAKEHQCFESYDSDYNCSVLDEDRIVDEVEGKLSEGGKIVDYHGCDFFPESWFDIVFVLRTTTEHLYDRLAKRGYTGKKLEDNMQCEIFQTLLEEARDAFGPNTVHELPSNTCDDMEDNANRIEQWLVEWSKVSNHT